MVLVNVKKSLSCFLKKYKYLYNPVPYNSDDMHAIESTIFGRLHNCENVKYVVSHSDVINVVSFKKMVNQMGLRVYFLIIFFMLLIDFTLFYLFYTLF